MNSTHEDVIKSHLINTLDRARRAMVITSSDGAFLAAYSVSGGGSVFDIFLQRFDAHGVLAAGAEGADGGSELPLDNGGFAIFRGQELGETHVREHRVDVPCKLADRKTPGDLPKDTDTIGQPMDISAGIWVDRKSSYAGSFTQRVSV